MNIKKTLKNNPLTKNIFGKLKEIKIAKISSNRLKYHGIFQDKSKGREKLCIILAGYKPYLYSTVFGRIKKELPDDIDVCVITSGLFVKEIEKLCRINVWSYLSTHENHVGLVQNVAINLHPSAKYIYKLDEDIFVTESYFDKMFNAYIHSLNGQYNPGAIAPIIPINGYGYVRILEKLNLIEEYERKFGKIKIAASQNKICTTNIETLPEIARFFWGEGGFIPSVDELNKMFNTGILEEIPCPIRFSIGAILFTRELWKNMGMFEVNYKYEHMGRDEVQLCTYCNIMSQPIMVSENIVVGHFSFGSQTESMKQYFYEHPERFL